MLSIFTNQKKVFIALLAEIVLLISLVVVAAFLLRMQTVGQDKFNSASKLRYESYLLADQLRQSSDDLTRMVRSYAVSGNSQFKQYFWDILAIRDGEKARPQNYERIYWDFMTVPNPEAPFRDGDKAPLEELMRQAGFTEREFQLLAKAKKNSDDLVLLEEIAMNAMVGKFQDSESNFTISREPDPGLASNILFGLEYHDAKKNIMGPINEFFLEIDGRTSQAVLQADSQVQFYLTALIVVFGALVINAILLFLTAQQYQRLLIGRLQNAIDNQQQEITERKRIEQELERSNRQLMTLSITDGLTGVVNRRHFDQVLSHEYLRHTRSGEQLSLLLLDIDYFKQFNDHYGHVKGDECLKEIAEKISECLTRPADIVARYGGEEFVCILPETDRNGAITVAQKILQHVQAAKIPHKGSLVGEYVSASLGVVTSYCTSEKSEEHLIARADSLLYRAKGSGRNRIEFLESDLAMEESKSKFLQLKWQDAYCCGNRLIDSQHRSLFKISNELMEAIVSDSDSARISGIITCFLEEIDQHFHDEEEILKTAGFPNSTNHAAEHRAILDKGLRLKEKLGRTQLSVDEILAFLSTEYIVGHFFKADQEFFPYLQEHKDC